MFEIISYHEDVSSSVSVIAGWHGMAFAFEVDYICDQIARGSTTVCDNLMRASDSTAVIEQLHSRSLQNRQLPNG